jgi:hypothetical protein
MLSIVGVAAFMSASLLPDLYGFDATPAPYLSVRRDPGAATVVTRGALHPSGFTIDSANKAKPSGFHRSLRKPADHIGCAPSEQDGTAGVAQSGARRRPQWRHRRHVAVC